MAEGKEFGIYQCKSCRKKFLAGNYIMVRKATGSTIKHCGEVAYFLEWLDWESKGKGTCGECEQEKEIDKDGCCSNCCYNNLATFSQEVWG